MLKLKSEYEGKVLHGLDELDSKILELLKKDEIILKYFTVE